MCVLKELGIAPGLHCKQACKKQDYTRQRHDRRRAQKSPERRKKIKNYKKGYSDHLEALEGEPLYEAGAF